MAMLNNALKNVKGFVKNFAQGFTSGFSEFMDSIYYEVEDTSNQAFFDFVKGFLFAAFLILLYVVCTAIAGV